MVMSPLHSTHSSQEAAVLVKKPDILAVVLSSVRVLMCSLVIGDKNIKLGMAMLDLGMAKNPLTYD